jgi:hypothetical protein
VLKSHNHAAEAVAAAVVVAPTLANETLSNGRLWTRSTFSLAGSFPFGIDRWMPEVWVLAQQEGCSPGPYESPPRSRDTVVVAFVAPFPSWRAFSSFASWKIET